MKKTILLSFALFLGTAVFAQTKTAVKSGSATRGNTTTNSSSSGTTTGTSTSSGTPMNSNICYIGKTWKLTKVEKFGVEKAPGDDQKNDMLQLNSDGTFKVTLKGVEKTGTYSRGSWLMLKPADGSESMPYKIISCEGNTLKADWRDGDTHNNFTYSAQ